MSAIDFRVKNGLVVNEGVQILSTTASTNKDTGALIVEGGVGIETRLNVGTDLAVSGNTTLTGTLAVNNPSITTTSTGTATVFNANATTLNIGQAATTVSIGQTSGTTTVRNALTIGGAFTSNSGAASFQPSNASITISPTGSGTVTLNPTTLGTINNMSIGATTASTGRFTNTTITGTLTAGGVTGTIGQALVSTGTGIQWATPNSINFGTTNVTIPTVNGNITATVNGTLVTTWTNTNINIPLTTGSTSTTTGALTVAGGVGIGERLYAGSIQNTPIGTVQRSSGAFTTLTSNAATTFTAGTASTNTSSGTLIVTGGIGVTGAVNTGLSSTFAGFSSTSTTTISPSNASVAISPTGTGTVTMAPATLGSINNMSIGATTASTGAFTTLTSSSTTTFSPSNASVAISPTGTGTVTMAPATLGSINNMSIGATTASTGRFTTGAFTQATGTAPFTVASTTLVSNLNANLLNGFNSAQASTVSTVAVRDASGDINVRLVRSEFANQTTISGAMAFRINNSTDNFVRFCSDTAAIRTFLDVPTRAGGNASGTWAISITGNANTASTAVNLSTTRADWSTNGTINAVVGQLAWKNFGNNHTIFDASNSTSPQGTAVNNTNAAIAWTGSYPTLMGWNGTSTYGVRVDSARVSDNTSGNAATVTNGVYTVGNQDIGGTKNFTTATVHTPATLGGTLGNTSLYQSFRGSNGNSNFLDTFMLRTSAGGDWTTAGTRIQQRIDSTWMGYQQFNGTSNLGGIEWGSGTTTSSPQAISARMRLDSSGSLRLLANIASTTTTTGTLIVTGGVGISGQLTVGTIVETSSIAYKENINPIDNALNKVLKLVGVTYDRKDGSKINEAGLIAEEVAEVIPNIVSEKDGKPEGIQYTKLTAYLIECIKELNAKIERLEGKK